jgi:Ni,Fe-hydrogenase III small subunit/ferredoxin
MLNLIWRGIKTGVVTTRYPYAHETMSEGYIGQIDLRQDKLQPDVAETAEAQCPTGAIEALPDGRIRLDRGRCICCGLCARLAPQMFVPVAAFETAVTNRNDLMVESGAANAPKSLDSQRAGNAPIFRRSLHIRHVDTGDDNSTISEVSLLDSPAYDLHRLGFFFSTSPRHADALLVTGVVARPMARALREAYDAMAAPRLVIAAGTEAISGVPFDGSYPVEGGVDSVLPVDVYIPGSPPAPLALLYGLLLAVGRGRPVDTKQGRSEDRS